MVTKILRSISLGVFLAASIGAYSPPSFADSILKISIEYGTAYDWGSIVLLDNGGSVVINDPPELSDGTRVIVKFADFNSKRVVVDVLDLN